LNRGWRFCRPLPYHLATAPSESDCARGVPAASTGGDNSVSFGGSQEQSSTRHETARPKRRRSEGARAATGRVANTSARSESATKRRRSGARLGLQPSPFPAASRASEAGHAGPRRTRRARRGAGVPADSILERETGFEPATSTLARSHSTTELFPPTRTARQRHTPGSAAVWKPQSYHSAARPSKATARRAEARASAFERRPGPHETPKAEG
jgi:hypothetical protein